MGRLENRYFSRESRKISLCTPYPVRVSSIFIGMSLLNPSMVLEEHEVLQDLARHVTRRAAPPRVQRGPCRDNMALFRRKKVIHYVAITRIREREERELRSRSKGQDAKFVSCRHLS